MAGAGFKTFATGDVLTASDVNTYLMQQTVMVFASSAARTTALGANVAEGMLSYLKDTDQVEVYNGSAWVASDDPNAIQNTIVDAKGDLITATANDTPARLAVGSDGSILVANSAASTGLGWAGNYQAGKNFIINGGFDNWQRGTASTSSSGAYTGADRWYTYTLTNGNTRQVTLAVGSTSTYGVQFTSTSATNSFLYGTALEDIMANTLRGKTVTISFNAYCSTGTVSLVSYFQKNATANNATVGSWSTISAPTSTITTTDTRYTMTALSVPSDSSAAGLRVLFGADNITNGANFVVHSVQLEIGSIATPFSRAGGTIQGELAACQRYYYRQGGLNTYQSFGFGAADQTTTAQILIALPVMMRVAPTSVDFSTLAVTMGSSTVALTNLTLTTNNEGNSQAYVYATVASGLTQYRPYILCANNSTNGYVGLSAEL